jgi:TPR repeat protein
MEWFKKAAEQGHPEASYNLALGHLKGLHNHIDETYYTFLSSLTFYSLFLYFLKRKAKELIKHAATNNVHEAQQTLDMLCSRGGCDE